MVMELVQGGTLEDRVKAGGPLSPAEVEALLPPLLDGLEKVHEAGYLHRDIKPGNILLNEVGVPTLIDFGAARMAVAGRSSTMTAIFTPGYAAPEQFATGKQGPWTDIYGLAATLHHAITGKPPPSAFDRLLDDTYQPLTGQELTGFPPALLAGIDAGLSVRFEDRPQSIADWRALLCGTLVDPNVTMVMPQPAVPPTPPTPPAPPTPPTPPTQAAELAVGPKKRSRTKPVLVGAAAMLLALAGGAYFLTEKPGQELQKAETPSSATAPAPETPADPIEMARAGEEGLKLTAADRQRIQVILTALGHDTRGSDGAFGQRSREMIAAWQKAKGQTSTGYLTAAQVPALLREAPASPTTRPSPQSGSSTPSPRQAGAYDGVYGGGMTSSGFGQASGVVTAELSIAGSLLIGRITQPGCGTSSLSLAVSPNGDISGGGRLYEGQDCSLAVFTATGRAAGGAVTLELRATASSMRGNLGRRGN
jgi:hypothetical protein